VLQTTFFNHPSPATPPLLHLRRGKGWDSTTETIEVTATNGFLAETEAFERLVRQDRLIGRGRPRKSQSTFMLTLEPSCTAHARESR